MEAIEQRLDDSLNQDKQPSEESHLKLIVTAKRAVLDKKIPQLLGELEWQSIEMQYIELRVQIMS